MEKARLKRVFSWFIRLILPPVCPICEAVVDEPHMLCPACFGKLNFITKPYCNKCGRPFEFDVKGDMTCAACLKNNPPYHVARSVFVYDDGSKKLILPFKHADRTDLTHLLSVFLLQNYKELITNADIIIPVPLYITRLLKRRYNQAALLAKRLAKETKTQYEPMVLYRKRSTASQGHMNAKKRAQNVKGAFAVRHADAIVGKKILLIDDVMTTGATACECSKVLLKAGAHQVDVLTVARVTH